MSSSRWRRFAFFDRDVLSLPPDALSDITQTRQQHLDSSGAESTSGTATTASSSITSSLLSEDEDDIDDNNIEQTEKGEFDDEEDEEDDPQRARVIMDVTHLPSPPPPPMLANIASATAVARTATIPVSRPAMAKAASAKATTSAPNPSGIPAPPVGGLILALIAGRNSNKVHCVDLSNRCSPGIDEDDEEDEDEYDEEEDDDEEDEEGDGYRGFLRPFVILPVPSSGNSSSASQNSNMSEMERRVMDEHLQSSSSSTSSRKKNRKNKRIIALDSTYLHKHKNRQRGSTLFSAFLSDDVSSYGVCLLVDFHKHLMVLPSQQLLMSLPGASKLLAYVPNCKSGGGWDMEYLKLYGVPTSVAIQNVADDSVVVAVGTSQGAIMFFVANVNQMGGGGRKQSNSGCDTRGMDLVHVLPPLSHMNTSSSSSNNGISSTKNRDGDATDMPVRKVHFSIVTQMSNFDAKGLRKPSSQYEMNIFAYYGHKASNITKSDTKCSTNRSSSKSKQDTVYLHTMITSQGRARMEVALGKSRQMQYPIARSAAVALPLPQHQDGDESSYKKHGQTSLTSSSNGNLKGTRPLILSDLDLCTGGRLYVGTEDRVYTFFPSSDTESGSATNNSSTSNTNNNDSVLNSNIPSHPSTPTIYPIDDGGNTKVLMSCIPPFSTDAAAANLQEVQATAKANNKEPPQQQDTLDPYILIATSDRKSGRDAVDVYDTSTRVVAFHVLLSPGHRALASSSILVPPPPDSSLLQQSVYDEEMVPLTAKSTSLILTSGGSLVTLTEKPTSEKVALLIQKNMYDAAISVSSSDPNHPSTAIYELYRKHAEFLYRKGDYAASMERYIHTIGYLESGHIICRFLDAPKIPLLAKYLERVRSSALVGSGVHDELLRTCYWKLNDVQAAERVAKSSYFTVSMGTTSSSSSSSKGQQISNGMTTLIANLLTGVGPGNEVFGLTVTSASNNSGSSNNTSGPTEALRLLCTLPAAQVAEILSSVHGATLARALPRETAGIVIALCDGTYSPASLASAADATAGGAMSTTTTEKVPHTSNDPSSMISKKYPVDMFSRAFLENPRLLRLVLSHCRRYQCPLSVEMRRAHLELTLEDWNACRKVGNAETEKLRSEEAMAVLTDAHAHELGDYESLVIVQMAGFKRGEMLLYERLNMPSMLLELYGENGGERERRQMLAMCRTDPELLADVLGYFVSLAGERIGIENNKSKSNNSTTKNNVNNTSSNNSHDEDDSFSEVDEILEDIQEALDMARAQGVLTPVRIARILAGEGSGQFSNSEDIQSNGNGGDVGTLGGSGGRSIPLSVALDYVGGILDDSSKEISRLKAEVEEYNHACNSMENEIKNLLSSAHPQENIEICQQSIVPSLDIDVMYDKLQQSLDENGNIIDSGDTSSVVGMMTNNYSSHDCSMSGGNHKSNIIQEEFWREMGQSEDRFETLTRYFGRGLIA